MGTDLTAYISELFGPGIEAKPEGKPEESPARYRSLERAAEIDAILAEQAKRQAAAILKSEQLRSRINHAIKSGQPPEDVLLLALECIGLITGDSTAYHMASTAPVRPQNAPEHQKR